MVTVFVLMLRIFDCYVYHRKNKYRDNTPNEQNISHIFGYLSMPFVFFYYLIVLDNIGWASRKIILRSPSIYNDHSTIRHLLCTPVVVSMAE